MDMVRGAKRLMASIRIIRIIYYCSRIPPYIFYLKPRELYHSFGEQFFDGYCRASEANDTTNSSAGRPWDYEKSIVLFLAIHQEAILCELGLELVGKMYAALLQAVFLDAAYAQISHEVVFDAVLHACMGLTTGSRELRQSRTARYTTVQ